MLCKYFAHVGLGDTGEGIVRAGVYRNLIRHGKLKMVDERAHIPLYWFHDVWAEKGHDPDAFPPSFTMVRNPFDWRISYWLHELRMRRYEGTFADFCRFWKPTWHDVWQDAERPGVRLIDYWGYMGGPDIDHVGQFEFFKRDLGTLLLKFLPKKILTAEELEGWYPEIYACWHGRPWVEAIEQWMREELFTPDLIDLVYREDEYFFERWNYAFDDHFRPGGSPPSSGASRTIWGLW